MLKATDLRIGNILKTPAHYPVKVLQILTDGVQIEYSSGSAGVIPYDNFSFVPLDSEWLERFGFVRNKPSAGGNDEWAGFSLWSKGDFSLLGMKHGARLYFGRNKEWKIEYVHQLQNLYHALTGEELTIKTGLPKTK